MLRLPGADEINALLHVRHGIVPVVFVFDRQTSVEALAAKFLKDEPIKFLMIGWGQLQDKVVRYIAQHSLKNIELVTVFQEPDALRQRILCLFRHYPAPVNP